METHLKDKTVVIPFYPYNWNSFTRKTVFFILRWPADIDSVDLWKQNMFLYILHIIVRIISSILVKIQTGLQSIYRSPPPP